MCLVKILKMAFYDEIHWCFLIGWWRNMQIFYSYHFCVVFFMSGCRLSCLYNIIFIVYMCIWNLYLWKILLHSVTVLVQCIDLFLAAAPYVIDNEGNYPLITMNILYPHDIYSIWCTVLFFREGNWIFPLLFEWVYFQLIFRFSLSLFTPNFVYYEQTLIEIIISYLMFRCIFYPWTCTLMWIAILVCVSLI